MQIMTAFCITFSPYNLNLNLLSTMIIILGS